jgi:RNA polymerase primary sigma factor
MRAKVNGRISVGEYNETSQYFKELNNYSRLTAEEEIELAGKIKNGDAEAKEVLILSNLRLVVAVARRYAGKGIKFADLISEGNLGLITATTRYDAEKKVRFSTYAVWWIEHSISRLVADTVKMVRVPNTTMKIALRMKNFIEEFKSREQRKPTKKEICAAMGIPEKTLAIYFKALYPQGFFDDFVKKGNEDSREKNSENYLSKVIGPEEIVYKMECERILNEALEYLPGREREIIIRRRGLDNHNKQTLEVISEDLGITRERVRQIENRAIKMLLALVKRIEGTELNQEDLLAIKNIERKKNKNK